MGCYFIEVACLDLVTQELFLCGCSGLLLQVVVLVQLRFCLPWNEVELDVKLQQVVLGQAEAADRCFCS